jgi:serine/threonine protein kinase
MYDKDENIVGQRLFARKLIRLYGHSTHDDVEREVRAIIRVCDGQHPNIIKILRHGWLDEGRPTFYFYYIDMELCDMDLEYYIYRDRSTFTDYMTPSFLNPAFVLRDCSRRVHLLNSWTIANQITQGLESIHSSGLTHRDLKPRNGKFSAIAS